jgi:hypothetical protein
MNITENKKISLILVTLSGLILSTLLQIISVSGDTRFMSEVVEFISITGSYILAYVLLYYVFSSKVRRLNWWFYDCLFVSLIGSFFQLIFLLIQNLRNDWWYISEHTEELYSRHIGPDIFFFFFFFFAYSFILGILLFLFWLARKFTNKGEFIKN